MYKKMCFTCGGNYNKDFVDKPCPECGRQYNIMNVDSLVKATEFTEISNKVKQEKIKIANEDNTKKLSRCCVVKRIVIKV